MIHINFRDARPIYEQVRDGLRSLMVTGVLAAGEKLPSVRSLATELAINPNTIQRAYRELESEGYIYSVPGKGSFAGENREVGADRKAELLRQFDEAVRELSFLGIDGDTLCRRIISCPRCGSWPPA